MKHIPVLLIFSLLTSLNIQAQYLNLKWTNILTSPDRITNRTSLVTNDTSIYESGTFEDSLVLKSDLNPFILVAPEGEVHAYLIKYRADGLVEWGAHFGDSSEHAVFALEEAPNGDVIFCGDLDGTYDLDPSPNALFLTNKKGKGSFIARWTANGDLAWARTLESSGEVVAFDLAVDHDGKIYVAGHFRDSVYLDGMGSSLGQFHAADSSTDYFILKLDSAGNFLWAAAGASKYDNKIWGLEIDHNNDLLVHGQFQGTVDFDPGISNHFLTSKHKNHFVSKIKANGELVWVDTLSVAIPVKIAVDDANSILVTGAFEGTVDFDPGPGKFIRTTAFTDRHEAFILRLTPDGSFNWIKQLESGPGLTFSFGSAVLPEGSERIFSGGTYFGKPDIDPGEDSIFLNTWGQNTYLLETDSLGAYVHHHVFNGLGMSSMTKWGDLFLISGNFLYDSFAMTGTLDSTFYSHTDLISSAAVMLLELCRSDTLFNAVNEPDTQYFECDIRSVGSPHAITGCGNRITGVSDITLPITREGVYEVNWNFNDRNGHTTTRKQFVKLEYIDTAVQSFDSFLMADADGYTYQWLDCDEGFREMPWATERTYTPTRSGSYAVRIGNGDCERRSGCHTVTVLGIDDADDREGPVRLYPNPATGSVLIQWKETQRHFRVNVYNASGVLVQQEVFTGQATRSAKIELPGTGGLYWLELIDQEGVRYSFKQKTVI